MKSADKGSTILVWDKNDYMREVSNFSIQGAEVIDKDLVDFVAESSKQFLNLEGKNVIQKKKKTILNLVLKRLSTRQSCHQTETSHLICSVAN